MMMNDSVSITNFGTFSVYKYHKHAAVHIETGELRITRPVIRARLHVHDSFRRLAKERKAHLKEILDLTEKEPPIEKDD